MNNKLVSTHNSPKHSADIPASILVVQEDPVQIYAINTAFRAVLNKFNMVVAEAEGDLQDYLGGQEEKPLYDLIIFDFENNESDASDFLSRFLANIRFKNVPIVILGDDKDKELATQAHDRANIMIFPKRKLPDMAPMIVKTMMLSWSDGRKTERSPGVVRSYRTLFAANDREAAPLSQGKPMIRTSRFGQQADKKAAG